MDSSREHLSRRNEGLQSTRHKKGNGGSYQETAPVTAQQNYFSKEYVDELQVFYQREREGYRNRIFTLESDLDRQREDMKAQIESLIV